MKGSTVHQRQSLNYRLRQIENDRSHHHGDRQQKAVMQQYVVPCGPGHSNQQQRKYGPPRADPARIQSEIEDGCDRDRSEVAQKLGREETLVLAQQALALRVCAPMHVVEDERERQCRYGQIARRSVDVYQEYTDQGRRKHDVRLQPQIQRLEENPAFEERQSKERPSQSYVQRL